MMAPCVVFVLSSMFLVASSSHSESVTASKNGSDVLNAHRSCIEVKQVYTIKDIGPTHDVPSSKVSGKNLRECPSDMSCCTTSMEEGYRKAAQKDFWIMLQSSSSDLKTLLHTSAAALKENFLSMIHASRNNTDVLFSEVYKKMDVVAQGPVSQLYSDLAAYIRGITIDLESRTNMFFDRMFPLVYHHSINPKLKDFSEEYKECLRQTQREIMPFGDIPGRVTTHITRSFATARTILESLDLALEVVNATDHMTFSEECTSSLVKLVYCAHCRGYVNAKPCSGYCLNVVRGCLANVAELDQPLIDFVNSLERLTSGLVASYNIEEVLSVLDTKISEAIMFAMENGPDLSKRVKVACGQPRRAAREVVEPNSISTGTAPGRIVPVRTKEDSLYAKLQQLVQRLAETKGQYANLADVLCSDDSWAVRKEGRCWNGEALGEYTKTIAGVGVAAQRYNPEMKAPKSEDPMVSRLSSKLETMSRRLRESIAPDRPQSDSYTIEGSGSGAWMRTNRIAGNGASEDDEDYDEKGSGSGDWGGTKSSDFNFDSGDVRHTNINIKIDGASAHYCSSSVVGLFSLLVIMLNTVCLLSDP